MKASFTLTLRENRHLLVIAAANFALVYASSFVKAYGYFIDEFYYIACAARPAWGYVDHPPLAPVILTLFQSVFGTSLPAIRILPALAQSGSVFLTGMLAKEIGGARFAQVVAACAMATAPMIVTFAGFYSMNVFEPLIAVSFMIAAVRMVKENNPRYWILLGLIIGLGLMNKHTFALFVIASVLSLVVAGQGKLILNKWFILGACVAFLVFVPNILWQAWNDYPSLEFYRNISARKNVHTSPAAFVSGQIMAMSPFTLPVWLGGTMFLIFSRKLKSFRFLAVLFLGLFLFMMVSGTSRADRMSFGYPAVLAGGGVFLEDFILRHHVRWLKFVLIGSMYTGLAIALPIVLPYFNYDQVRSYTSFIGLNTELERGNRPSLPQILADRIGWEEKFKLVLNAYESLPESEKKETIIAAGNYGQAGALELFGKDYDFPPVVSGHNSYYLWSKTRLHGSIVLQLGQQKDVNTLMNLFERVEECPGEFTSDYVTSHENHLRVFICRGPKIPLPNMLEKARFYY